MAIAGAFLALGFASAASAQQTVTLVGATGNTCSFSGGLTVSPAGALTISCSGVVPPTSGATFTLLAPALIDINTTGNVQTTVTRSGGAGLGTLSITYSVSGNGCTASSGALSFAEGDATPQTISITTGATGGTTCQVALTPPTGSVASPSSASISIVDPNPQPQNGCPTPDPNALAVNVNFATAIPVTEASGVIGYVAVPSPTIATRSSVRYIQSIGTTTANLMHTEFSVSPCKGAILTPSNSTMIAPQCYVSSDNTNAVQLDIYTKPIFSWTSQATLGSRGCWIGSGGGPYYLNFRWTYSGCAYGTCGFVMQWANGPY